jgi:hypothetical protein
VRFSDFSIGQRFYRLDPDRTDAPRLVYSTFPAGAPRRRGALHASQPG